MCAVGVGPINEGGPRRSSSVALPSSSPPHGQRTMPSFSSNRDADNPELSMVDHYNSHSKFIDGREAKIILVAGLNSRYGAILNAVW